jgi:response regulator RpfG family c-di-GMP phosphodiesterase
MIKDQSGKHFDPCMVKVFLAREDRIRRIWKAAKDIESFLGEM